MDYNHHYDKIADVYDQFKLAEWDDQMFPWFIENLKVRLELNNEDVLADLGGATGKVIAALRENIKPTKDWVNIDPSPKMCEIASKLQGVIVVEARADMAVPILKKEALTNPPTKFMAKHCAHHF